MGKITNLRVSIAPASDERLGGIYDVFDEPIEPLDTLLYSDDLVDCKIYRHEDMSYVVSQEFPNGENLAYPPLLYFPYPFGADMEAGESFVPILSDHLSLVTAHLTAGIALTTESFGEGVRVTGTPQLSSSGVPTAENFTLNYAPPGLNTFRPSAVLGLPVFIFGSDYDFVTWIGVGLFFREDYASIYQPWLDAYAVRQVASRPINLPLSDLEQYFVAPGDSISYLSESGMNWVVGAPEVRGETSLPSAAVVADEPSSIVVEGGGGPDPNALYQVRTSLKHAKLRGTVDDLLVKA